MGVSQADRLSPEELEAYKAKHLRPWTRDDFLRANLRRMMLAFSLQSHAQYIPDKPDVDQSVEAIRERYAVEAERLGV